MVKLLFLVVTLCVVHCSQADRPTVSSSAIRNTNEQFLAHESNGYVAPNRNRENAYIQSNINKQLHSAHNEKPTYAAAAGSTNNNFRPLPATRDTTPATNVKQLVQMYNNRDEEVKRTQSGKPFSYSSVAAGTHKQAPVSPILDKPPAIVPSSPSVNLPTNLKPSSPTRVNSGPPTDEELKQLSETLLRKDTNNAAKLITVNYQGHTSSSSRIDQAPLPLMQIPATVWNISTIRTMTSLWDNYEKDTLTNEVVTPMERNEENAFLDSILETAVMRQLINFLKEKGIVTPDPRQQREYLKRLWFNMYSRGQGRIGSSGFEHVFLMEIKNNQISGLHNWLYLSAEEAAHRANYLGYLKKLEFGDKGAVLKFHFVYNNIDKPVDTMFVGTSPELEIALYTLCFTFRADVACPIKLGGKDLIIRTYTFRYRSKNMIGGAFPEI